MSFEGFRKIFLSIILPSVGAIILFFVAVYVFYIPSFEESKLSSKKEMINELTNTAWSLIKEYNDETIDSLITLDEAQKLARTRIERMRYGADSKDYFWIIDKTPIMIMHPYRPELNNTDLSDYMDPKGKKLFVEAVELVKSDGDGYIDYIWQSNDDSTKLVPKLSYVKGFEDWGWIIGTGVYLDDVEAEIALMKRRLIRISLAILVMVALILLFIIRQSLKIENKRKDTEDKLLQSREKYRTLVSAATDGTLMIADGKVIFSNQKFNQMTGYTSDEILSLGFNNLFSIPWKEVELNLDQPDMSFTFETSLILVNNLTQDVVITVSKVNFTGQVGVIVVVRDVSRERQIERDTEQLSAELQTSLLLMNQPIRSFVHDYIKCKLDTSIGDAALLMTRKKSHVILVSDGERIIGVVNDSDLRARVISTGLSLETPVSEVMTAPVISISDEALLYEVMLYFKQNNVSHLAVKDKTGKISGIISNENILEMQHNALSYLLREIEAALIPQDLKAIYSRVPVLVNALMESGDKTPLITRIITSVSDAITKQIIKLELEDMGDPPCRFAFIALGSEGRMEQTIATDQDNAIIFEDLDEQEAQKAREWFLAFAERVNNQLGEVGYELCKGNIMAMNPEYTMTLSGWKNRFEKWISVPEPQNVLDTSIFFDFRTIYGDEQFIIELRKHINALIERNVVFMFHMAQNVIKYKTPVSMFGNIVGDATGDDAAFDVKRVLLPILTFIKVYTLKHQLSETNTLQRLEQLVLQGEVQESTGNELKLAYNYLMNLRFRTQIDAVKQNRKPDNYIEIAKLADLEKTTIKKIFSVINDIQTKLSIDFKA